MLRVASIRALGALAQMRSARPMLDRAQALLRSSSLPVGELLEIAAALGKILPNANHEDALHFLDRLRRAELHAPEVEVAFARIAPERFVNEFSLRDTDWRQVSAAVAGLQEIAALKEPASLKPRALQIAQRLADAPNTSDRVMPDVLRALQAFKPDGLVTTMIERLKAKDVFVRAAAADIVAELPASPESTTALLLALPAAAQDTQNDAALSIVGALAASKEGRATAALEIGRAHV